jgi:hypothetical protein
MGEDKSAYDVTLREYLEAKLESTERALALARSELDRRLESMNEFRLQMKDQASTFICREEYEAKHQLLIEKIEVAGAGKVPWGVTVALALASAGIVGLLVAFLTHMVK